MEFIGTHPDVAAVLTDREHQVVRLVCIGLTNKEIAERLSISPRTAEIHRLAAAHKVRARNIAELIFAVLTGTPGRRRSVQDDE